MKPKNTCYGAYKTLPNEHEPAATTRFQFQPLNLITDWERCSLTANFFSNIQASKVQKPTPKVTNVLSSVVNELLESSIKYSVDKSKPANLNMTVQDGKLHFELSITCDKLDAIQFERFYKKAFEAKDLDMVILEMLEKYSESDNISVAIGLLTFKRDFNADIGVQILPVENDKYLYNISTLIIIDLNEVNKA